MTTLLKVRTTAGAEFLCAGLSALSGELVAPVFQLDMPDGDRLFVSAARLQSVEPYAPADRAESRAGTLFDCPPVRMSPEDAEALGAALARVEAARAKSAPEGST